MWHSWRARCFLAHSTAERFSRCVAPTRSRFKTARIRGDLLRRCQERFFTWTGWISAWRFLPGSCIRSFRSRFRVAHVLFTTLCESFGNYIFEERRRDKRSGRGTFTRRDSRAARWGDRSASGGHDCRCVTTRTYVGVSEVSSASNFPGEHTCACSCGTKRYCSHAVLSW